MTLHMQEKGIRQSKRHYGRTILESEFSTPSTKHSSSDLYIGTTSLEELRAAFSSAIQSYFALANRSR